MNIRLAIPADMDELMRVYASARAYMAATGNPNQWGADYPSRELLGGDMELGRLYVCEHEGLVCGAFVLALGEDPTYAEI